MAHDHGKRRVGLWLLAGAAGLIMLLWLVIVVLPRYFAPGSAFSTMAEAVKGQNDVRTTLLQGTAGLLVLTSAVAGAYFTWRQVQHNAQILKQAQEQLGLARAGQVTERFTRAVDQLGSKRLDVRLGGIYALERIARDFEEDSPVVVDILSAYVRTHAPWPPSQPGQLAGDVAREKLPLLKVRAPDVQAVVSIMGRRHFAVDRSVEIDLNDTDLRHASLLKASLSGADLSRASMIWTDFGWADLSEAKLMWCDLGWANLGAAQLCRAQLHWANLGCANLGGANIQKAKLVEANLGGADLGKADLRGADLRKANLRDADLGDADFRGADLRDADLRGVDLREAKLTGADLTSARTDDLTRWPEGFTREHSEVRTVVPEPL
jgi:uncharacterized protein YjbI with pentapeptide repeats